MNNYIILLLLFICSATAFSQEITVRDFSSQNPVINAKLTSDNVSLYTNVLGQVDISKFKNSEKIIITSSDYITQTLSYEKIQSLGYTILLSQKSYRTDEIVISANKFDENSKFLPRQIEVLNSEDIAFSNSQNTGDLLQQTGTVFVQKSQMGGGSPVLRGFEANKVLIMIDGVRLNNLIFRGGHLQNVLRIDDNTLNRTEILFGSGSTVYGSDALGGVMSFYTKNPILSLDNNTFKTGTAYYRYSSANTENTGHFDFNFSSKSFGFLGSVTYSNFNSLSMGKSNVKNDAWLRKFNAERINGKDTMIATNNYFLQDPSGYNQFDILGKGLYKPSENIDHTFNFQYSNTTDIPRYDRLNTINPNTGNFTSAQWYYGPESRILGSYKLGLKGKQTFYDNSNILLAYQNVQESRNNRSFGSSNLTSRSEDVNVYSLNADFSKRINLSNKSSYHDLSYGIEGFYNTVTSTAFRKNINTNVESPADTRYPDGDNNMTTIAGYIMDTWKINEKVYSNIGARYSYVGLNASFIDTSFYKFAELYPDGISQNNSAFSGNLGFTFLPKDDWKVYINGATGFRAPDIDDLAKIFESTPRTGTEYGTVIVPNPDLGPEYTYGGEIGLSNVFSNRIFAQAVGYYTYINDAIVTAPYTYNGSSTIIYDGDTANVQANQNAQTGYIWGTTLSLNADITNFISMTNTVTYTYGRVTTADTTAPLDHIPPLFGKSAFLLNLSKFQGEFSILYNAWKLKKDYSTSGEDNFQDATPDGMPNWFTLNVKGQYQLSTNFQMQLEINNLLDQNYRVFASGINAPGINSVLTLRANY
ncbi:MAG TPA: TonB-dependent receptor [Ignavibacteria bacterium]|nr:TonB-dependent receptor [Ignavibacteria bacterium]